MTEQSTEPAGRPTGVVEFQGRSVEITMPRPEQILVWQRTLQGLQAINPESWTGPEILAAMERLRKIIDSILVNKADVDWIDDEMLAGRLTLKECAGLVTDAVRAFEQPTNREERRAAEKATKKPARRVAKKSTGKKDK
jgi:hypothetical protein